MGSCDGFSFSMTKLSPVVVTMIFPPLVLTASCVGSRLPVRAAGTLDLGGFVLRDRITLKVTGHPARRG